MSESAERRAMRRMVKAGRKMVRVTHNYGEASRRAAEATDKLVETINQGREAQA